MGELEGQIETETLPRGQVVMDFEIGCYGN